MKYSWKEARMIQARVAHFSKRYWDLRAYGFSGDEANKAAFDEAKNLKFTRAGRVK